MSGVDVHTDLSTNAAEAAGDAASDLVFEVSGEWLPRDHANALWSALTAQLPWLADEPRAGVHAVRGAPTEGGLLLSRRARLVLRLPRRRHAQAAQLTGCRLQVEGGSLGIGAVRERPLEPHPTLHAQFVATGAADDLGHQQAVQALLDGFGLPARFICGRMRLIRCEAGAIAGASVVVHGLRPEHSLRIQRHGLGGLRHLGCGLFVAHRTISGID